MFEVTVKAAGETTSFRVSEMTLMITPLYSIFERNFEGTRISEIYLVSINAVTDEG